jgi:hypothetical protein
MPKKFSYCTQRNIPCKVNAQNWYLKNAIQKMKNSNNIYEKMYYKSIVDYYYNGKAIIN